MKVEKLIEKLEALKNAYGDCKVFIKEDEHEIRMVEDVVLEEAIIMFDDEKVKKHRYFLIG